GWRTASTASASAARGGTKTRPASSTPSSINWPRPSNRNRINAAAAGRPLGPARGGAGGGVPRPASSRGWSVGGGGIRGAGRTPPYHLRLLGGGPSATGATPRPGPSQRHRPPPANSRSPVNEGNP